MAQPAATTSHRLGPFPAGASPSDLTALVGQGDLGLRVLDGQEQASEYHRARCEALESAAREFFYPYPGTRSLVLQKTRESSLLPDFAEYVFCWFADDRLCGAILSGVTSDAGTHGQMNQQEAEAEAHAAELAEALARKYPETPRSFLNDFNFEILPALPDLDGQRAAELFLPFERMLDLSEDTEAEPRIETAYCGPALVSFTARPQLAELPTGSTHSSESHRRAFANPDCLVVYDFKLERYVRTIESIHVYETLTYLSRSLARELGRRLNAAHAARIRDEAAARIHEWRAALERAEGARRARIDRLVEIL